MAKRFASWAESERVTLSLMLQREQCGWFAMVPYFIISCQLRGGGMTVLLLQMLGLPLIYWVNRFLNYLHVLKHRMMIIIIYFELVQISHYKWAIQTPEDSLAFLLASTVALITYQLSPILPWPVNLLIIAKHMCFWYFVHLSSALPISRFGVECICWALFHICAYLLIRKRTILAQYLHLQSLHRNEGHIAALYDALPNGILVITEEKKVASYNSVLLDFLGLQMKPAVEEEVYSRITQLKYVSEYAKEESRSEAPVVNDIMEYIVSEKKGLVSFGVVLINGKYLEWRANKLEWDLKKACIVCVRDITRWVELENIAKRESISKSALIRSVSHELRTPTNAIINIAQDMRNNEDFPQESQQDVLMLSNSAQFLLSMINDLLDYSSFTNGKFGLTKQFFSLKDTVQECVQLIDLQCKYKKLELIMRYDPLLPALAYNDKNRLKQVILNLLSNAMKFTMAGKIEVAAVSVSETHAGIRVIDSGVGIPEDSIGKIFTLFGKLEGNENLNPQGCGLGLSISSMLVKSMGGSGIHVKSKRYIGSLFAFDFNITRSDDVIQPSGSLHDMPEFIEGVCKIVIPGAVSEKIEKSYPYILVVDDVDYNRIVLRKILESVGYECDEATNGVQVLQLVASRANTGKPYLVILMDVEMPEMDGITATRELVALAHSGELQTLPVIIGCSAYSSIEDRELCLRAGMQSYLEKPIMRESLYDLLSNVVARVF